MLKALGGFAATSSIGAVTYKGTWDAATNTPTLASGTGTQGDYYVVSVPGSTNLDGITDWAVGDWAIFNGTVWEKVDNTDAVSSVNGQVGTVVLNAANVGAVANTVFVNATGLLTGGGQLTGNVAIDLTSIPIANVSNGVADTIEIIAGTGLSGGGNLAANVSIALANTAVSPGVYGNGSNVSQITVDAQGRITSAANVAISASVPDPLVVNDLTAGNVSILTSLSANLASSNTAAMPDPSLPLNPEGYIEVVVNGTTKKIPYYGV
jgi:hypothetical protein